MEEYYCTECGERHIVDQHRWRCDCGGPLELALDVDFRPDLLAGRLPTFWRYREALPKIAEGSIVTFGEGFTPLAKFDTAQGHVHLKLEFLLPSGSFKDRGTAVLVSKVKELGVREIVMDSSGNLGASMACYAAKAGVRCRVFVPASTSKGKTLQTRWYGAEVVEVQGTRDDTTQATIEAAKSSFYASHYWNPYFFQGTKTFSYEVWEQLGRRAPDTVILPVGMGTLVMGAHKGFLDLQKAGIIDNLPKIIAVQCEQFAPLYEIFSKNLNELPWVPEGKTMAEGIAIRTPSRWKEIVAAVRDTGGSVVTISDDEIVASLREWMPRGVYMEPTSSVVTAAFRKLREAGMDLGKTVVLGISGSGLKTPEVLTKLLEETK